MSIREEIIAQAREARRAARILANLSTEVKDQALEAIAQSLEVSMAEIMAENRKDLEAGEKAGLSKALLDRLLLNEERIKGMAEGLRELIKLKDPVGDIIEMWRRPNGLQVGKMRVPMGVIAIIYEARPNVTIDAAGLCLKAGNAVILRGGSEAINSNRILARIAAEAIARVGLPAASIQLIQTTDREAVSVLLGLNEYLDLLIPRGGAGLIRRVINEARVPVIETGTGNCHIYVDQGADLEMAREIVFNAKTSRPGVCNAVETLLVHRDIAGEFLPELYQVLKESQVELRGCPGAREIIPEIKEATEEDWQEEYLDYILAIKLVKDFEEAVNHINTYGTKHSEAIITNDYSRSQRFLQEVDAAAVYVNASTRFTDGNQFGLGAEIGISTQKLHARGPMGLNELTSCKFVIYGQGQIRE
ncbi:MAG TPA: glutamate-5-semialdehyde dehydrogenase [Halanaerobiaceae bacterium]|nr:glutamate-5-semialdehyde dehydrogenase [Bacillota bacterium]HHU92665.1 glutamate-5-semialdehyde dehydrogenase [Halanaerobiaceae bacterium]HOA41642.1 glutamate-5-semialdehyde dehydrogenase [Halanaerobiales bacterium]HPZ63174.1 glutamate-5-semialdehyde dehydrogenase [Halanaerobiales bacterium]HQD04294.1 glutamate-5-semialdehyde dehydrogenase [Halanaerobiales bacterium]